MGKEFERTLEFVLRAGSVPIDNKPANGGFWPLKPACQSPEQYERAYEITGRYLGTDDTLEEIGGELRLTRERVRQIVEQIIRRLYKTADKSIQADYPLETLDLKKPRTLVSRGKHSRLNRDRASLTAKDLSYEEKRGIMSKVSRHRLRTGLKGDTPLFVTVSDLAKEAGLFVRGRELVSLVKTLEELVIPVGKIETSGRKGRKFYYYFICATDKKEAVRMLRNNKASC